MVALLVAAVAVLVHLLKSARKSATMPPLPASQSAAIVSAQNAVTKATQAEIEELWDALNDDDSGDLIAKASDEARGNR